MMQKKVIKMPLYAQVKEYIIDLIEESEYDFKKPLIPEIQISEELGVSIGTVKKAMSELVLEGAIERKPGLGTFVKTKKIKKRLNRIYSFSEDIIKEGYMYNNRILDFYKTDADLSISKYLKLKSDNKLFFYTKLQIADNKPVMISYHYLPSQFFKNLKKEQCAKSIYDIITQDFGYEILKEEVSLEPIILDGEKSKLLESKKGSPALLTKTITYDLNKVPIAYAEDIIRGDSCKLFIEVV
jgi:GntR family transcriptional regulator